MDVLYFYKESASGGYEMRYSLRSLAMHAPYIRKVWIYGDAPHFMSDDKNIIECIKESYAVNVLGIRAPVKNTFLRHFLASITPEMEHEYLFFSDDFFLLKDYPIEEARKDRYLQDLRKIKNRGTGLWKENLWRTHDLLVRLGYSGYNYETHAPTYFTKKRVLEAFCAFKDFTTQDPWYGMMGITAILNHAQKHEPFEPININEEGSRAGFWEKPPTYEEILGTVAGRRFLNFDDKALGNDMKRFLSEQYPTPCKYEKS